MFILRENIFKKSYLSVALAGPSSQFKGSPCRTSNCIVILHWKIVLLLIPELIGNEHFLLLLIKEDQRRAK